MTTSSDALETIMHDLDHASDDLRTAITDAIRNDPNLPNFLNLTDRRIFLAIRSQIALLDDSDRNHLIDELTDDSC